MPLKADAKAIGLPGYPAKKRELIPALRNS
jgi:hypothetical protein